jgi:hypothetical protein
MLRVFLTDLLVALSLIDSLPAPTPAPMLPSMPPPAIGAWLLREDFEHGDAAWQTTGGTGDLGFHHLRAVACGGRYTMVLGRLHNEPYSGVGCTADLSLKQALDLRKAKHPRLQYDLKGVTTPLDLITIRPYARRPGGAWAPIGAVGHARYTLVATFTADLSAYAGGYMELRFHGQIGQSRQPNKGLYLDDVYVLEPRVNAAQRKQT